jgi:hypothetical protein
MAQCITSQANICCGHIHEEINFLQTQICCGHIYEETNSMQTNLSTKEFATTTFINKDTFMEK